MTTNPESLPPDEVGDEVDAGSPDPPRTPKTGEWRGIVLVTGTDTDVGKTIVTAAIAAAAQAAGLRVAVIKPGQTGTSGGGPTDIDLVNPLGLFMTNSVIKGAVNKIRITVHNVGVVDATNVVTHVKWLPFTVAPGRRNRAGPHL